MIDEPTPDAAKIFQNRLKLTAKGRHGAVSMDREKARQTLSYILSGKAQPAQTSAFLTAMRFKGTEKEEFLGFLDAMEEYAHCIRVDVPHLVNCNGPYDGRKKSLLLTVASSIIACAGGASVILHSSSNLPPKYGVTTADVLEYLGIPAYLAPEDVAEQLRSTGFGFMHAMRYLHGVESLRSLRELLGYRSFINACEVIMNPTGAKRFLIGAAHDHFLLKLSEVLVARGAVHVLAVEGLDGSDELPLEEAKILEYKNGEFQHSTISPLSFGFPLQRHAKGATAKETAHTTLRLLSNEDPTHRPAAVYNAGIRLYLAEKASSIAEGINLASELLSSGRAQAKLAQIRDAL